MRNLRNNTSGQSAYSYLLLATLVATVGLTGFTQLGGGFTNSLVGSSTAHAAQSTTPSLSSRTQAAVSAAARAAYRAARAVTNAMSDATDASKLVDAAAGGQLVHLVKEAKRLAEEAGYVTVLRIADEATDAPLAMTLLKKDRISLVDGSLSTKQFDIFTLDQAKRPDGTPVRVLPDEDGHYLFGLSQGAIPDFYNAVVGQDLVRTTLLTSLDRIDILNDESAMRVARKLAETSELSVEELYAQYRPRLGPWAPENVVDGAFNNQGSRLRVKPQFTTAIAEGSGLDMNAFSTTGGNGRPHLAMGAYADRNGRLYSTALSEKIVWHEYGHAEFDGARPEYRYPGYIKNGDPDYQLEDIPDFFNRHGREIKPRELSPQELGTRLFFARAAHEWRADHQARVGAMHDPTIIKKFIASGADMRVRKNNPLLEVGKRFAEDLGIEEGGLRSKNPAETLPQAFKLQQGRAQPNPYDFAVVMKRWEEDAIAELYENKLLALAEEAGDVSAIDNPDIIARALEQASDDFQDLSKWAAMHPDMDRGPDFGRYAFLMIRGAQTGEALDAPQPEMAAVLLNSAVQRGLIKAEVTESGIQIASETDFSVLGGRMLESMGGNMTAEEKAKRLIEASELYDHRNPIQ